MIGQHDDRFYHRRRWERSERSETTSASRIEYPNRCDWRCSHDRERRIRRVRNNSVGRCHVEIFVRPMRYKGCQQAHNAQVVLCALFTTRNSLRLQGRRKAFSPVRKVCAISQRLCSQSGTTAVKSPYARPFRTSRGFLHWRFAYAGPTVRAAPPSWGRHPQTFTITDIRQCYLAGALSL
jgi:hypothetical protein